MRLHPDAESTPKSREITLCRAFLRALEAPGVLTVSPVTPSTPDSVCGGRRAEMS